MSTATDLQLIRPHGGELVDATGERPEDLDSLEAVTLTSREVSDLDMLACGALSPLTGFMGHEDYERVVDRHWDPPVTLMARLVSIEQDAVQHLGQAAYVRGVLRRT